MRFYIFQLYPVLFKKGNSLPIKLFKQKAHIERFFSSSIFIRNPINNKLNTKRFTKERGIIQKSWGWGWEKGHTQIANIKGVSKIKKLMHNQCYCCFVEIKGPRLLRKGKNKPREAEE